MRVIEIAHVEGYPLPVLTLDGEPFSRSNSVTAHMAYMEPTKIFINGHRVTEPTRLVKHGLVVAQDNVDAEVEPQKVPDRTMTEILVEAIPEILDPFHTPLSAGINADTIREAVERANHSYLEPRTWVHHPSCAAVAADRLRPLKCMGALSGCYLS